MTTQRARATRGFFLVLIAAFLLLAAFVVGLEGILSPSPLRLVFAVAAALVALLLIRTGHASFRERGEEEEDHGSTHRSGP